MADTSKTVKKRPAKTNKLGIELTQYKGGKTTLCAGCGHNAISERITQAFFEMNVNPYQVIKLSGIGCSSKSPAYFLNASHAFNSVHGRMPSIATGSLLANRNLLGIGISGDGDTASIGMGQFIHLMRRNIPFIYVVEDNGCYGLTKGQFSATADKGSKLKTGILNEFPPIDLCTLAIELGATFVARSFSGDRKQLSAILKSAIAHKGTAFVDIISPCVTFNDHDGSTKSYAYIQENNEYTSEVSFVPHFDNIEIDYEPGDTVSVKLHDGSTLLLSKLADKESSFDRIKSLQMLQQARTKDEVLTGVFYVEPEAPTLFDTLGIADEPLVAMDEKKLRPSENNFNEIMDSLK